ncbi:MAG: hypothetical protein VB120_03620 [Lachnospiraceae bacterium]|nr:hypothetical protein [Lachnospiraceae bacterium]
MVQNDIDKLGKWKYFFILFLFTPAMLINFKMNNDIWFLLNTGRYILANGFPHTEPFTLHQNFHFVVQQWLSSIIFWKIYDIAGSLGLFLLCNIIYIAMVLVFFKLSLLISEKNFFVSYGVSLFVSLLASFLYITTRPQIFTHLFIIIEIYLLELYIRNKNPRYLIGLPILSFLQINFHAAMWPMLFVILIPYFIDGLSFNVFFIRSEGYGIKPLLITVLLMLAVAFLNPYGLEAMTYLFHSYGHKEISEAITEMGIPNINKFIGKTIFAHALVFVFILCLWKKGKLSLRNLCLVLGTGYMSLSSIRSWCYFILCSGVALSEYLKEVNIPETNEPSQKEIKTRKLLALFITVLFIFGSGVRTKEALMPNELPETYGSIEYLKENGYSPNDITLYMDYNNGGYGEFEGYKPYLDPRAEVFVIENNHVSDVMLEYFNLQKGELHYKDFINSYKFTHIIATPGDTLYTYIPKDPGYHLLYEDEECSLYEANSYKKP